MSLTAARRLLNGTSAAASPGATCAVCGGAGDGVKLGDVVSDNFTTWDLVGGDRASNCCHACEAVFRDFKFRNKALIATSHGIVAADAAAFRAAILDGSTPQALTWPSSRKKHCWLNAGISDATTLRIGGDDQTVVFGRADAVALLPVIERLYEAGATKLEVRTGMYRPAVMQRLGYNFNDVESVLRPARFAGALDILVWCCEREAGSGKGEVAVLTPEDKIATELLARLANGSSLRTQDAMGFWSGAYLARIQRRTGAPDLMAFIEAVAADIGTIGAPLRDVVTWVEALEDQASILPRIARSPRILIAMAQTEAAERRKPADGAPRRTTRLAPSNQPGDLPGDPTLNDEFPSLF